MNGARSTYMRRGYLFTALAAAVLLAAFFWDGVGTGNRHGAGNEHGERG